MRKVLFMPKEGEQIKLRNFEMKRSQGLGVWLRQLSGLSLIFMMASLSSCHEMSDTINESDRILSQYTIGSSLDSLRISEDQIIFRLENKRGWNAADMNVVLKGYGQPKKFVRNNHTLLLLGRGEYAVYLYFDIGDKLVDKEIVGT